MGAWYKTVRKKEKKEERKFCRVLISRSTCPNVCMGQKTVVSGSPSQPQLMRATQCEDLNIFHKSSFKDTLHTQTYQEIEDKYKPTALLYFNENAYCSNI